MNPPSYPSGTVISDNTLNSLSPYVFVIASAVTSNSGFFEVFTEIAASPFSRTKLLSAVIYPVLLTVYSIVSPAAYELKSKAPFVYGT